MKIAYADPPYLGCGRLYQKLHPDALEWDELERHKRLIEQLCNEYPDGWALSASAPSLRQIWPVCPGDVRVMIWVKPFAVFKPNVNPAFAWEPVIVRGGRKRTREQETVRDWVAANITMQTGTPGAKPTDFCMWLFKVLNLQQDDELIDLFPGSGNVRQAWETYKNLIPLQFQSPIVKERTCCVCGGPIPRGIEWHGWLDGKPVHADCALKFDFSLPSKRQ